MPRLLLEMEGEQVSQIDRNELMGCGSRSNRSVVVGGGPDGVVARRWAEMAVVS